MSGWGPNNDKTEKPTDKKKWLIGNTEITMFLFGVDTGLGNGSVIKECPSKHED